jgi:hypothetical protein
MSPTQHQKLKRNIEETGKYPSLIVLETKENYILLDGHNRLEILKEIGHTEVWCEPWKVTDKQAKLILATINRLRGTDDVQKRGELISQLYKDFDEDKSIILKLIPETEKSLNSILKVAEAEMGDVEDILEKEKQFIKTQMEGVLDPEEAERIANIYKDFPDGKPRMVFVFNEEKDYYKAITVFGHRKPDTNKLMELVKYARKNRKTKKTKKNKKRS